MAEDRYANWMGLEVTESAANTLSFAERLTGVGFGTGKGQLIDQIDYFIPNATLQLIVGGNDRIDFAICSSSGVLDLEDVTDSRILHSGSFIETDHGTPGVATFHHMPIVHQFFPSLIHANQRIFIGLAGASLATPATIRARIYWRFVDLSDRNIAELVQATLLQG